MPKRIHFLWLIYLKFPGKQPLDLLSLGATGALLSGELGANSKEIQGNRGPRNDTYYTLSISIIRHSQAIFLKMQKL